jgi:ubiquinone/menaquinone biosynthesis C-methylase UbiE
MGYYSDNVLPRLLNRAMDTKVERPARERVCGGLRGDVVEIGFGSGLNTPYYPSAVTKVLAVEPSRVSMQLAEPRIATATAPVQFAGLDGQRLDLPSDSADAVLSTWTLCTIPDLASALAEIRRVLKPDGAFHFVEHGHAPDPNVARWQQRIEPLNKRLAGGCHLTRRITDQIESAGFVIDQIDRYYAKGVPKPWAYTFEGRAVVAPDA